MTVVIVVYTAVSLVIGGICTTYEIWHCPIMLDRADGRGKFQSPKMSGGELIFFGLFVALLWPILVLLLILGTRSAR